MLIMPHSEQRKIVNTKSMAKLQFLLPFPIQKELTKNSQQVICTQKWYHWKIHLILEKNKPSYWYFNGKLKKSYGSLIAAMQNKNIPKYAWYLQVNVSLTVLHLFYDISLWKTKNKISENLIGWITYITWKMLTCGIS